MKCFKNVLEFAAKAIQYCITVYDEARRQVAMNYAPKDYDKYTKEIRELEIMHANLVKFLKT